METEKIVIYSEYKSNRLVYTCDIVFRNILKINYEIINDKSKLQDDKLKTINYSNENIENSTWIIPSGLLEQTGIREQNIKTRKINGIASIFYNGKGDIRFDIFSAVFYMLSRYEEYLPSETDEHGRFRSINSLAFKKRFHKEPVVEYWIRHLSSILQIKFHDDTFNTLVTIDVDFAWKFLNRGFFKNFGGFVKSVFKLDFTLATERISVLTKRTADPYFTFGYLDKIQKKLSHPIQYFILIGRKKLDNAVSYRKKASKSIVRKLDSLNPVGIHPSYSSNKSLKELRNEIKTLNKITGGQTIKSRQHYLKLKIPKTYQTLINLGIKEEYTMGWSDQTGFRAGISRPYLFYDISKEQQTELLIFPFVAMDRTLKDYLKLAPVEALKELKKIKEKVKSVGGQFCILWHNDSLSDKEEWAGWREVFEKIIS